MKGVPSREEAKNKVEALAMLVVGSVGAERGPERGIVATERAADAMDAAMAGAWKDGAKTAACAQGCSFCCRGVRVEVMKPELARLVAHARASLDADALASLEERAAANATRVKSSARAYPAQMPCALLGDDAMCLVYEARPLACRRQHSLDVSKCEAAFEAQGRGQTAGTIDQAVEVAAEATIAMIGYRKGLKDAHINDAVHELQGALHAALSKPKAR